MSLDVKKKFVLPNMQKEHCNDLSFLNILTVKQGTWVYLWFWRISHEFVNFKLEVFLNQ